MGVYVIKTFFATLRKNKIPFVGFFMFYVVAALIIPVTYIIAQIITGEMGQAAYELDTTAIIRFLIILTIVMGVRAVFSALDDLLLGRFVGKVGYSFRVNFAKFFLRQPFAKFEKNNSGQSLSVFTNDLPEAVEHVRYGMVWLIYNLALFLVIIVYMFYFNWLYTLIFVVAIPVLALVQIAISAPIQKISREVNEARDGFNATVNDSLQNIATVISYNLEEEMENRYISAYSKFSLASMIRVRLYSSLVLAGMIFSALPLIFLFIASGLAVAGGTMLISEYIVYTTIGVMAASVLMSLAEAIGGVGAGNAGTLRLNETTTGEAENIGSNQGLGISGETAVAFDNITFAYAEDLPDVLHDVSIEIPRHAKVAIVGGSGSGKSTILKLLLGLYEPKSGKINVLGNDTATIGKYALRDSIAYVPQDSFLFPASICENITGKNVITSQEHTKLEKVCQDAGILDFINSLPNRFDNILSESSENISGGQRQRIAMARAFYKDAPIILFDEATSSLDPITESEILKSLENATKDKTVIMVAHRAAARAFCDTVITMEEGRIV